MEHEYYTGLSILIAVVYATKKFGPSLAKSLDKDVDVSRCSFFYDKIGTNVFCCYRPMRLNGIKVVRTN